MTLRLTVVAPHRDLYPLPFPLGKFQAHWNIQAISHHPLGLAQRWRMIKHAVIPLRHSAAEPPWWRWQSTEKDTQTRTTLLLSQSQNNPPFPPLSTSKFSHASPPAVYFTCTNCSLFLSTVNKTTGILYTGQHFVYPLESYICLPAWRDHKEQQDTCSNPVNKIL